MERQVASLICSRSPAANAAAGDHRLHLNEAVEDALPRRPILPGAHGGSFLIAHHHFFLGIPVNGPPTEPKRQVAEVAYGRRSMAQLQIAERFVARLDTTDPVALVGVEHLLFQRFAATWGAAARASAGFTLCAPAPRAAPAAGSRLSFDPRLRPGVVEHRTADRLLALEPWNQVGRVVAHLRNHLVGAQQQIALVPHDDGARAVAVPVGFA